MIPRSLFPADQSSSRRWLTLAGVSAAAANVVIPLAIDQTQPEPYHSPKILWLLLISSLIVYSFGAALWADAGLRRHIFREKLIWLSLGVLGALTLSALFSVNPHTSFFSDPYLNQGWLAWVGYFCVFLGVSVSSRALRLHVYQAIEVAAGVVALWVIGERVGLVSVTSTAQPQIRPPGPLGSAQYTGEWLCLAFFVLLASPVARRTPMQRRVMAALIVLAIAITRCRAALIGLAAGGVYLAMVRLNASRQRRQGVRLLAVIALIGLGWFALSVSWHGADDNQITGRLLNMFNADASAAQGRLVLWRDSQQMIGDQFAQGRWLAGYGLETLNQIYGPYMTDQLARIDPGRSPFAPPYYAHNQFLDIWRDAGLIGFVAINLWLGVALWYGVRSGRGTTSRRRLLALLAAIPAGTLAIGLYYGSNTLITGVYLSLGAASVLFGLFQTIRRVNHEKTALLAGLLASIVALQFGFLTPATGVLLWTAVGLLTPPPDSGEQPASRLRVSVQYPQALALLVLVIGFMTSRVDGPGIDSVIASRTAVISLAVLGVGVAAWPRTRAILLGIVPLAFVLNFVLLRQYHQGADFSLSWLQVWVGARIVVWSSGRGRDRVRGRAAQGLAARPGLGRSGAVDADRERRAGVHGANADAIRSGVGCPKLGDAARPV